MKKFVVLTICLMLLLCACGGGETAETTVPAVTEAPAATEAPAETTEAPAETAVPAETEAPATEAAEASAMDLANTCVDKSVEELYALIGEPLDAEYAPSCLGEGEDGNLYYEGFTVYTYKDEAGETVTFVE